MAWGTYHKSYAVKIEVQMAFAQLGPEIECPRVPRVRFGQCPNRLCNFLSGASLTSPVYKTTFSPDEVNLNVGQENI